MILIDADSNLVDRVSFGTQATDVSYGRWPNGTGAFTAMPPSFEMENRLPTNADEPFLEQATLFVYPNPTRGILNLKSAGIESDKKIMVFTINGQVILETNYHSQIDLTYLPPGLYILRYGSQAIRIIKE
mgnify:CR=1 FL=1